MTFAKSELEEIKVILDEFREFCSRLGGRFIKETETFEEIPTISEINVACMLPEEKDVLVDISHLRRVDEIDIDIRADGSNFEMELDFGNEVDFKSNKVDRVSTKTTGKSYRNMVFTRGRIIKLNISPRMTAKGWKQNWKIRVL